MKKDSLYVVLKVHKTKYSSLAQSVEHSAVNRSVVGSSPTGGAKNNPVNACVYGFSLSQNKNKSALKRGAIDHMAAKATAGVLTEK